MSECGRTDIVTTVDGRELLFRCDREGWDHPGRHHATNVEGVELFWSRSGEARAASQERPQTGREPKHTEGQGEMCDPDCPHWSARWEQHDDSCECHIGICADCGCTNEARAAPQERPQPKLDRLRLLLGAYLSTEQYEECRDLLDASQERPPIDVHHEHWRFFADHPLPWKLSDTSAGFAVEDANHEVLWRFDHYNRADVERFVASLNDVVSIEEGPYIRGYNRGWEDAERPPIDVERLLKLVLLEAAHYNVFQGKVAHTNLRMIVDAARDSATRLSGSVGE